MCLLIASNIDLLITWISKHWLNLFFDFCVTKELDGLKSDLIPGSYEGSTVTIAKSALKITSIIGSGIVRYSMMHDNRESFEIDTKILCGPLCKHRQTCPQWLGMQDKDK